MAKKSKTSATLEKPSVFAFERRIEPSDGLLFSGNWDDRDDAGKWQPILLKAKIERGTVVNRLKPTEEDAAALNLNDERANIQTVDCADLPAHHDTMRLQFTLRIRPKFWGPSACDSPSYLEGFKKAMEAYLDKKEGMGILAQRYARNIANGRFLWRNRRSADEVEVRVEALEKGKPTPPWTFDSFSEPFCDMGKMEACSEGDALSSLSQLVEKGLLEKYVLLRVTAFARVGAGQSVFPSQEFIQKPEGVKAKKGDKSKTLYSVNGVAALHSQKIGNAIRTIDNWYSGAAANGPISVEAYGSVTSMARAWRKSANKEDFYTLLDRWVLKNEWPRTESGDQSHYVIAMLIRGGVFGEAK